MKKIISIIFAFCLFFSFLIFGNITWTDPDEYTFQYNILQNKPINKTNNPLLKNGPHFAWGFNEAFFTVTRNSLHVEFSNKRLKKIMEIKGFKTAEQAAKYSPNSDELSELKGFYDTAPTFNSREGARMSISTTISGSVIDPWTFFKHFKDPQYSYEAEGKISSHLRVYEALYQANELVDVKLTEIGQEISSRKIQIQQENIKSKLLKEAKTYMKQFGFNIDNLMFTDRFVYLDGSEIIKARSKLGNVNSEIRQRETELDQAKETQTKEVDAAKREAKRIISKAKREAEKLTTGANALAKQLKTSIDRIGVNATVDLYRTKLVAPLLKKGVVKELYLSEDSFIGKAIN